MIPHQVRKDMMSVEREWMQNDASQ